MAVGHHMLQRKIQQLLLAQMCDWILRSWDLILAEAIANSFRNTGIAIALDEFEDHFC
jgi:hypothetical protein